MNDSTVEIDIAQAHSSAAPPDRAQRRQALDVSQSFICEAPAGSGKTELLTQRILALLAECTQPEEILAITFTRKAAAEMRQRVLSALHLAQGAAPQEPHKKNTWRLARQALYNDEKHQWQLLLSPSRLQIKTFDSFCAEIARQLPLHSRLGSAINMTEDPEEAYQHAIDNFLAMLELGHTESENPAHKPLATLLLHLDNNFNRLSQLLISLLYKRDIWAPIFSQAELQESHREILESHLQHILDDKIRAITEQMPEVMVQQLLTLACYAADNLDAEKIHTPLASFKTFDRLSRLLPGSTEDEIPYWLGLRFLLFTAAGELRKTVNKNTGFPAGEGLDKRLCTFHKALAKELLSELAQCPALLDALQNLFSLPTNTYDDKQWQLLSSLTRLLPLLLAQLQLSFKTQSALDFTEVSLRATSALGDELSPTDLALRLDYRIKHILVDEFQDTSSNQLHLLKKLTYGWQPDDGRTLFCVGDSMQSIYSFRGANVGLFLYCKEHGIGDIYLEPLQLQANFRAQAGLVNWLNKAFYSAFPQKNDISTGAVSYSPATAVREKLPERAVLTHGFGEGTQAWDEARTILGIVRKTLKDKPHASIAILVRNRKHAEHILPLLRDANLAYRAVDLEPLREKMIIEDLLSLTQALLHPGNRVAWLSILRAPWCGLSLMDLEGLANSQNDGPESATHTSVLQSLENWLEKDAVPSQSGGVQQIDLFSLDECNNTNRRLSQDGCQRLRRIIPILKQVSNTRQQMPLRQWIEGCWIELGGPACLQSEEDRANAESFFNLLEREDHQGSLRSFAQFEKRLDTLFAQADPKASEQLQIMTIHKSKGLEFDVVILPSLHKGQRPPQAELLLWQERLRPNGDEELVFAPISPSGQEKDSIYQHLHQHNATKEKLETCRLLYVACTRARQELHLCADVSQAKNSTLTDALKAPPTHSLLHHIWPSIKNNIRVKTRPEMENEVCLPKSRLLRRLPANWTLPTLPEETILAKYVTDYDFENDPEEDAIHYADTSRRHVGTLVHQLLNQMCSSGLQAWRQNYRNDPENYQQNWRARLLGMGLARSQTESALKNTLHIIEKSLVDENVQWMFQSQHKKRLSEYPLSVLDQDCQVRHYIIDLFLQDAQGMFWIIDFKTSQPEAGQSTEAFLQQEKHVYLGTMNKYKKAIQKMGYFPITTALYFPLIGEWGYY